LKGAAIHSPARTANSVGAVEHTNTIYLNLQRCILSETKEDHDHWIKYVNILKKQYNERPNQDLGGLTPKEIMLGIKSDNPVCIMLSMTTLTTQVHQVNQKVFDSEDYQTYFKQFQKDLASNQALSESINKAAQQRRIAKSLSRHGVTSTVFAIGDWLFIAHFKRTDRVSKLMLNWKGPFRICGYTNSKLVYWVEDIRCYPDIGRRFAVHAQFMRYWLPDGGIDMSTDLKLAAEYSISQFQAEVIYKHRLNPTLKNYEVYCKWKGLSRNFNSWVCLRYLYSRVPTLVVAYLRTLPTAEYEVLTKTCLKK
jgi:hypothetical protein